MKVLIDGKTYRIRFVHGLTAHALNPSRSVRQELAEQGIICTRNCCEPVLLPRRCTVCAIERLDGDQPVETISMGRAICNPIENYVKREGRAKSLARCLEKLPDTLKPYADEFVAAYDTRKARAVV